MWLSKTGFVRLSIGLGVLCAVVIGIAAVRTAEVGPVAKHTGWTAAWQHGAWRVLNVYPEGPAASKLQRGDRVLAVDGDGRAARIGPDWYLQDRPSVEQYTIDIERSGTTLHFELAWPLQRDVGMHVLTWLHLFIGIVYIGVALVLAFARPDYPPVRLALWSGVLIGLFFAVLTLNRGDGLLTGIPLLVAMAIYGIIPFHVLSAYYFAASFPEGQPSTGGWKTMERVLAVCAVVAWVPMVAGAALRAPGGMRAVESAAAWYPWSVYALALFRPAQIFFDAFCAIAIAAVCRRNYRRLTDPDLRRRMRWIFFGIASGLFPVVLLVPLLFFVSSAHLRQRLIEFINVFVIINPFCVAYAVFKHRVLGVRVVLRMGMQYLLARNVLRVALAVPAVIVVATAVMHPDQTLGQLAAGPVGKLDLALLVITAVALRYRTSLLHGIDRRFFRESYRQEEIFVSLGEAIHRAHDLPEISRLLCSQIDAALHPRAIFAVSHEAPGEFSMVYSSSDQSPRGVHEFGIATSNVESLESSLDLSSSSGAQPPRFASLISLGIELLVPIRGPNEGLVGLLLLGPKRSEEPYAPSDRRMLETIATQTGIAWENLQLRHRLRREREVRQQVVRSAEGGMASGVMECPACGACYDAGTEVCGEDGRALTLSLPFARTLDGKYLLTRFLGRGGMGAVYQAKDLRLGRVVAVKLMMGNLFGQALAVQRFAREARASAKLDHPNVVRVFDFGELPGAGAYLVLEFLEGSTLRSELRLRGALPPAEAAALLGDVFEGVEAAHARHVIHRDLKPENVFLVRTAGDTRPVAKILDFGLAAVRDAGVSEETRLTHPGGRVGTVAYMSKEQFFGETVDERTDVFALAVVALETITGEISLRGPSFSEADGMIEERLCGPGSTPDHRALAEVFRRGMAAEREARFASVKALREALLPLLAACPPFYRQAAAAEGGSAETAAGE